MDKQLCGLESGAKQAYMNELEKDNGVFTVGMPRGICMFYLLISKVKLH